MTKNNPIAAESNNLHYCNPTMADESSWREWFSELEMDYHINYWRGNTLEQPQGLIINAPESTTTQSSSISEQTNLQGVMMSSNNNSTKHTLSPKSYEVSYENSNNASNLLVPSTTIIHDYNPCFALSNLGSDYHGTCYSSLPMSTSSSSLPMSTSSSSILVATQNMNNKRKNKRKSEPIDHIMSERRRRQELTKKFIALSATIPGLKKEMEDNDIFNKRHKTNSSLDVEGGSDGNNKNFVLKNNNNKRSMISNNILSHHQHTPSMKPPSTSSSKSPTTYILSFDDSTIVEVNTPETNRGKELYVEKVPPSIKGVVEKNHDFEESKDKEKKKGRSSTETLDHIMAERKRRREITERFIALSATIPGLKKIDKSTILSEAIIHVKQLKERVRELEEQINNKSVSFIRKSHIEGSTDGPILEAALPTVEARVLKKDVLIRIHCKKQSDIVLKILDHIKSLDLNTISNGVLPFGNSTLDISIIAQMGDKFSITTNDLVKNLRMAILEESPEAQQQ